MLSNHVTVQNLYLKKGAVWSLVSMESDHVLINNVNVQSDDITHDGIDIVDGTDVTVAGVRGQQRRRRDVPEERRSSRHRHA